MPYGRAVRGQLLLIDVVVLPIVVTLLTELPAPFRLLVAVPVGLMVAVEYRCAIVSPVTVALALFGVAAAITGMAGVLVSLTPVLVCGGLFLVSVACLLAGHPAFAAYRLNLKPISLDWANSILWAAIFVFASAVSLIESRWPGWHLLSLSVLYLGTLATLLLQLGKPGRNPEQPIDFAMGRFRFRQVSTGCDEIAAVYQHYTCEILPSIRSGQGPRTESLAALVRRKMEADRLDWRRIIFFAAYDGDQLVGTIACVKDDPVQGLPMETSHTAPLDLRRLRALGTIVEIGKFSISKDYRFGQDVIRGLIRCGADYALAQGVDFIVGQGYQPAKSVYQKMGFILLTDQAVYQKSGSGAAVYPMILNLSQRIVSNATATTLRGKGWSDRTRMDLVDRYSRRLAARNLLGFPAPWRLGREELIRLIEWHA